MYMHVQEHIVMHYYGFNGVYISLIVFILLCRFDCIFPSMLLHIFLDIILSIFVSADVFVFNEYVCVYAYSYVCVSMFCITLCLFVFIFRMLVCIFVYVCVNMFVFASSYICVYLCVDFPSAVPSRSMKLFMCSL